MSLEVKDLVSGYHSEVDILNGISLKAEESKITGIIGPNGAGKSTLLKTIYGFLKPKRGKIYYGKNDITGMEPYDLLRMGILYIPQFSTIFPDHTVYENLKIATWIFRKDRNRVKESIEKVYDVFPILKIKREAKASSLSGGQQKMLEFCKVFIFDSKLILIDEPSTGLAPKVVKEIYHIIEELKEKKLTVVLVDQNVKEVIGISDYIYLIDSGRVKLEGSQAKFKAEFKDLIRHWI